jgi:hypothetical protein
MAKSYRDQLKLKNKEFIKLVNDIQNDRLNTKLDTYRINNNEYR